MKSKMVYGMLFRVRAADFSVSLGDTPVSPSVIATVKGNAQ
ncbi:MAG TPA: hypothetical protein VHI75_09695 [Casimicrobiaceae bacterium]|nr:hypothetical protein [Casimicrobiaceae bacterium]